MTKDKIYHFAGSALIALLFTLLLNVIWGFMIAIAVGFGKELFDKIRGISDLIGWTYLLIF